MIEPRSVTPVAVISVAEKVLTKGAERGPTIFTEKSQTLPKPGSKQASAEYPVVEDMTRSIVVPIIAVAGMVIEVEVVLRAGQTNWDAISVAISNTLSLL